MWAKGAIGIVFIMQCHLYCGEVYWEVRLCSSRPLTQYITCMCSMLGELLQPFSHYHNTRNNVHANCRALPHDLKKFVLRSDYFHCSVLPYASEW